MKYSSGRAITSSTDGMLPWSPSEEPPDPFDFTEVPGTCKVTAPNIHSTYQHIVREQGHRLEAAWPLPPGSQGLVNSRNPTASIRIHLSFLWPSNTESLRRTAKRLLRICVHFAWELKASDMWYHDMNDSSSIESDMCMREALD
eukprot:749092-Hanusia_phi.AAC.7